MTEPLSSQLSRALVAFTIEADDELEHRVPHRTTNHGVRAGPEGAEGTPWLVSLLMWSTCLRFLSADGTSIRSYARSTWWLTPKGISTTLRRMGGWWGYLTVDGGEPEASPKRDRVIRLTPGGRRAKEAWEPLAGTVEGRWRDRFGERQVEALRAALEELVEQFGVPLPDCLRLYDVDLERRAPRRAEVASSLPGLLAQAVVRFELEFEAGHPLPVAVCGNLLPILGDPSPVKDLAVRTGLAKDGVEAGLRVLQQRRLATVGPDPGGGRWRVVTLTRAGVDRRRQAAELIEAIEGRWRERYGGQRMRALREALAPIVGRPDDPGGPLWGGLYRYPDGWRSSLPRPETLPRHPFVSHRGGYLDGA